MNRTTRRLALRGLTMAVAVAAATLLFTEHRALARQDPGSTTFRLLTFEAGGSGPRLGTTVGNGDQEIVDVHNAALYLLRTGAPEARTLGFIPADMRSLIEAGDTSMAAVRTVHDTITRLKASGGFQEPGGGHRVFHPPTGIAYLPPVLNPSKILGLAGNFIRASPDGKPGAFDNAEYPSAFLKPPSSMTGHNTDIDLRGLLTTGVHEPEMALVIGRTAVNVSQSDAMDYVMGYTILNDVSSRDLPQGTHTSQGSTVGKGLDTFSPVGPYITLKADVPDPHNMEVRGVINGELHTWPVPNGNTKYLTFTIPETIAYFSERMTLLPGDLIALGVPAPSMTFKEGDTVELTIGHLGTLRNRIVSTPPPGHTKFPPRKVTAP